MKSGLTRLVSKAELVSRHNNELHRSDSYMQTNAKNEREDARALNRTPVRMRYTLDEPEHHKQQFHKVSEPEVVYQRSPETHKKQTRVARKPQVITVDLRKTNMDVRYDKKLNNRPLKFATKPIHEPDYILLVNKSPGHKGKRVERDGDYVYDSNQDYVEHRQAHLHNGGHRVERSL